MEDFKTIEHSAALLLKAGELNQLKVYLSSLQRKNRNLVILANLINIFCEEVKHNSPTTVFDYSLDLKELINHYMLVKLLLRRLEFDFPPEYQRELYDYCKENGVSIYFLSHIIDRNIFDTEKVLERVEVLFGKGKGGDING